MTENTLSRPVGVAAPAPGDLGLTPELDLLVRRSVQLINLEATFLDRKQYHAWDELWVPDGGRYVLPIGRVVADFDDHLNLVNDDTTMRRRRIERMSGGFAHAANTTGPIARTVSRFTLVDCGADDVVIDSTEVVVALKHDVQQVWAAEMRHTLRQNDDGLRIREKVVWLLDSETTVRNCGFLL